MEPLVSVIVPVYKVEPYLRKCVDSILGQTYKNIEVILVDDGSPDNCGAICEEYAEMDERVKVIHKPNGGLSDARNAGMRASHGEYLMFVDSDDLLVTDSVEYLYSILKTNDADISVGGRERFDDNERIIDADFSGVKELCVMDSAEAMRHMFRHGCAAWARLYKREVHIEVEFPVGEINEDEAIVLRLLNKCSNVVRTNRIVYRYRCRTESITTSSFSTKKLVWQKHCADNLKFVQENYLELVPDAAARYRGSLMWSLTEMALSNEDFSAETAELLTKLKANKALFNDAPFDYPQDKIRMWMLTKLPFGVYKRFIRAKRNH